VVLQSGGTSSDIEMALELTAEFPRYPTGPVVITTQPAPYTSILTEGQPFALGVGVDGALPITYQWRKNGVPIAGRTNGTFVVAYATPGDAGAYTVVVSNPYGSATSAVANVTGEVNTLGPTILSAIGETNLSIVTVTLYDENGVHLVSASIAANYQVHLTAGGPNLGVV